MPDKKDFAAPPPLMKEQIAPIKIPIAKSKVDIPLSAKSGFDYHAEIEKMGQKAKDTMITDLPRPSIIVKDLPGLDLDAALLQQIRGHIQKKEFAEALKKLRGFLDKHPHHPEALYLKAVSRLSIEDGAPGLDPEVEALESLCEIRPSDARDLKGAIGILQARICGQVFMKFPILLLLRRGGLVAQIDRLIALDPLQGEYYAFKAILLLESNNILEAYDCVETGVSGLAHVPAILSGVKAAIEAQLLYHLFLPAIRLFKLGRYGESHQALLAVDPRFTRTSEYRLFEVYLKKLSGGGLRAIFGGRRRLEDVKIDGAPEERHRLQALIVQEEMTAAQAFLSRSDFAGCERVLWSALHFTPDYPLACFLAAGCRFRQFNDALSSGNVPNLDTVIEELETTRSLAATAAHDDGHPEVEQLLGQVNEAYAFLSELRIQAERRADELRRVNAVIQEFMAIMESAKAGIDSPAKFEELFGRMRALKGQVEKTAPLLYSEDARQAISQLEKAVDRNLDVLQDMSDQIGEQGPIKALGDRFVEIMDGIKGGVKSEAQLKGVISKLSGILKEIASLRRKLSTDGARKSLDQLEEVVQKNHDQAESLLMQSELRPKDTRIVEQHITTFKTIMDMLNSKVEFKSRDMLETFRSIVDTSRKSALEAKSKVTSHEARETLSTIADRYNDILEQIDRVL